jgi:hypothetical protein
MDIVGYSIIQQSKLCRPAEKEKGLFVSLMFPSQPIQQSKLCRPAEAGLSFLFYSLSLSLRLAPVIKQKMLLTEHSLLCDPGGITVLIF